MQEDEASAHVSSSGVEELMVRLVRGEFAADKKKYAPRNIQVRVALVSDAGDRLPCLLRGAGSSPELEYRSAVYYHCNSGTFNETVCVKKRGWMEGE